MVQVPLGKWLIVPAILLAFNCVFAFPTLATANGDEHGKHSMEMSGHMRAMMKIKKKIPEEYRIMNRTPVTPTGESLETGRKLFLQNCAVCHGDKGDGNGPAAGGMATKPANFLNLEHSSMYGPGEKFWIVENGLGEMGMPGFGNQLSAYDRWSLVNFIFHLQEKQRTETESLFPDQHKHSH